MKTNPLNRTSRASRLVSRCAAASLMIAGSVGAPLAQAGDDTIVTDRPDFVESSLTVGKGRFQIETSVNFERNHLDGVTEKTTTFPTLLRYGVSDSLELRLETDGYTRHAASDDGTGEVVKERGYSDVALGVKWHTRDGDEAAGTPSVAWLLHLEAPTGSSAFKGHGMRPSVRAAFEWELPQEFSLGVMPGIAIDKDDDHKRFAAGILGVVVGKAWTDKFRTFAEWAGRRLTSKAHGGSVITYDIGAASLLSESVQVDIAYSQGANHYSVDHALTLGFSIKF